MTYDGGSNENKIQEPNDFILFYYWMGRYHGLITAPETDDPSLTKAKLSDEEKQYSAEPYKGPKRPSVY